MSGYGVVSCCLITFLVMFLPRSRQLVAMGKEDFFAHEEPTGHHSLHQVVISSHYGEQTSPPAFQVDYTEKSGYKPGVDQRDGVSSYLGLIMAQVAPH